MSNTTVSGTITLPSSAGTGTTRMRFSMKYNGVSTSCETFTYGEVEDYTVVISSSGGKLSADPFTAQESIENNLIMTVSPNPVQDRLTINLEGFENMVNIIMIDLQGRVVYRANKVVANSTISNTISVSDFARGTYFVIARENNKITREKIVLIK